MKFIVNEIQISYKEQLDVHQMPKITGSKAAAELLYNHWDKKTIGCQECFKVVLLNNANRVKGVYEISKGSITGTLVDLRILFAIILKSLTVAIVLVHNHPSGNLCASQADKELTHKIKQAAGFFDVAVLDHLILAPNGSYFSFSDAFIL